MACFLFILSVQPGILSRFVSEFDRVEKAAVSDSSERITANSTCLRSLSQVLPKRWILRQKIQPEFHAQDHRASRSEAWCCQIARMAAARWPSNLGVSPPADEGSTACGRTGLAALSVPRHCLLKRTKDVGQRHCRLRFLIWRTRHDSNVWPLPSEGNALSS